MTLNEQALSLISQFEAHYDYDGAYMRELLESSPEGFAKFNNFMPMAQHREQLGLNDYWVAKLATMQAVDCGACLQLNVRMALEAGVARELVKAAVHGGDGLPDTLCDVYQYAACIAKNETVAPALMGRMQTRYNKGALLEFGLCIAAAMVFPTIKRAVGYVKACRLIEIDV